MGKTKWSFLVPITVAAAALLGGLSDASASALSASADGQGALRDDLLLQPATLSATGQLSQHRSHSSHSSHRSHYSSR